MRKKLNLWYAFLLPIVVLFLSFPIIGICLILVGINSNIRINKETENYVETTGYYKDKIYAYTDSEGIILYKLQYEYTINGDQYYIETDYSTNIIPKVGSEKVIKYNPDNPIQAVIIGFNSNGIMIIIGIAFVVLSSWWIVLIIIKKIKHIKYDVKNSNSKKIVIRKKVIKHDKDELNDDSDPIKNR